MIATARTTAMATAMVTASTLLTAARGVITTAMDTPLASGAAVRGVTTTAMAGAVVGVDTAMAWDGAIGAGADTVATWAAIAPSVRGTLTAAGTIRGKLHHESRAR